VGSAGASGLVTDDSETFRLGNLESEVVGGACGAPDRSTTHRVCHSVYKKHCSS
jgi:hypothetical protein